MFIAMNRLVSRSVRSDMFTEVLRANIALLWSAVAYNA
jgi:hypothetical protein